MDDTRRRRGRRILLAVALLALAGLVALTGFVALIRPEVRPGSPGVRRGRADAERLVATVTSLPGPRSPMDAAALGHTELLVETALKADGYTVYREEVRHAPGSTHAHPPVHSVFTKTPETGPFRLLAAHLDTVPRSPGADDDGSGVAVVLEVAHLLARTEAGSRTVFALFTEEETGLLGSRQFVDGLDPRVRARLEGVVVMDAVGFASHEPHSQKAPPPLQRFAPDVGDFLTVLTIRDDAAFSDQLVSMRNAVAPGLPLVTFSPPRLVADQLRDLWRSDHAPFWSAGLPALFLTDTGNFRNPHYHRPDDVPATLDGEFLASVAEVLAALFAAPP